LAISILPLKKIKKLIISNKLSSILIVAIISIFIGILENKDLIFSNKENYFIAYNIFLITSYLVVSIIYLEKSISQKEYIYSVISSSIFLFGVKAYYAIVGTTYPMPVIKLTSISITYMAFIIFMGGLFLELILSIKRNKELENKLTVFYQIVNENKYSCIVLYDEDGNIKFANKTVKNFIFKTPYREDKKVESVIINKMKEVDENLILEIKNSIRKYRTWKGNIYIPSLDMTVECSIQNIYTQFKENNYAIIFKDISEKLRTQKYLIEYEKMKKHEEVKNEFFANISHRSEEHTSELQSRFDLVCRLLLEKKTIQNTIVSRRGVFREVHLVTSIHQPPHGSGTTGTCYAADTRYYRYTICSVASSSQSHLYI